MNYFAPKLDEIIPLTVYNLLTQTFL